MAASNRFRVEQALRRAIDAGEFVLHYQPQVCLSRLEVTSVEALLRWKQSDSTIVSAGDFISVAEQSGLMLDLNDWILGQAARDVRAWRSAGWANARVAINVSAQQVMSGDFVGEIERLLLHHDLPADAIELELTENTLQTGAITVESREEIGSTFHIWLPQADFTEAEMEAKDIAADRARSGRRIRRLFFRID